jgi:hypothetical protein
MGSVAASDRTSSLLEKVNKSTGRSPKTGRTELAIDSIRPRNLLHASPAEPSTIKPDKKPEGPVLNSITGPTQTVFPSPQPCCATFPKQPPSSSMRLEGAGGCNLKQGLRACPLSGSNSAINPNEHPFDLIWMLCYKKHAFYPPDVPLLYLYQQGVSCLPDHSVSDSTD